MANRRKLRNILLEPRVQFAYAFRFFVFSAVAIVTIQLVAYFLVARVVRRVLTEAGPLHEGLAPVIDMAIRTELLRSTWVLPLVCVAAMAFTARLLHRFIGPTVPITRHLERLARGDYGAECHTRTNDELQDVVASLNSLSQALRSRHSVTSDEAAVEEKRREAGFSLIELLVVMSIVMTLGTIAVSQFIIAYDRSRQRSTLADLRSLAAANETYMLDQGDYVPNIVDLAPDYLRAPPLVDRWGFAWAYSPAAESYRLVSRGSDGAFGPAPPSNWNGPPFECDLVVQNGSFVQAPTTR